MGVFVRARDRDGRIFPSLSSLFEYHKLRNGFELSYSGFLKRLYEGMTIEQALMSDRKPNAGRKRRPAEEREVVCEVRSYRELLLTFMLYLCVRLDMPAEEVTAIGNRYGGDCQKVLEDLLRRRFNQFGISDEDLQKFEEYRRAGDEERERKKGVLPGKPD